MGRTTDGSVRALHLVTTPRPFFNQQIEVLESRGVECTVVTVPEPDGETRGVGAYARCYGDLLAELRGGGYDLVHANYGLVAPLALAQPVRPVVLSLWGTDVYGRFGWVADRLGRFFDARVAVSREMADRLPFGCRVVPHGVDFDRFSPVPRAEARAEVGWPRDRRQVLFPYDPDRDVKNYDRAERVVRRADEELPVPVDLRAVHGVPHERVPWYMNAANALLLTSRWEGSPNAVREALACDLPVVSTDVGDVREQVEGVARSYVCADDGELVDRLVAVLRSGERSNGRETARRYSLSRMGDRLLEVYASVLDGEAAASLRTAGTA
jgi:glycosyltransferase involved in cell wall biosynthesis